MKRHGSGCNRADALIAGCGRDVDGASGLSDGHVAGGGLDNRLAHDATERDVRSRAGTAPTPRRADEWARECERRGAGEILLTSIDADGTRAGYDLLLTAAVARAVRVPVVASGGAGCVRHLAEAFAAGAQAALVASIVHEAPERIPAMKAELREAGWAIRT